MIINRLLTLEFENIYYKYGNGNKNTIDVAYVKVGSSNVVFTVLNIRGFLWNTMTKL